MVRRLCVANQKGGVGKTTTSVNLAAGLAKSGAKVLVADLDPQCNATSNMGWRPLSRHPLAQNVPITDAFVNVEGASLDLLPGSSHAEDAIALAQPHGESNTLLDRLTDATHDYDFVVIDCPPSLGRLTELALSVSNEILMPVQCEYFAMEGLTQMIHLVRQVMQDKPDQLEFGGIVLTMFDHKLAFSREVEAEVREFFGDVVFDTVIPRDVAVAEASSHSLPVLDYLPRARGSRAYIELCMEVLDRE